MRRLNMLFPYLLFGAITAVVVATNVSSPITSEVRPGTAMHVCEPCGMEVDPRVAMTADINSKTKYFCNAACRDTALARMNDEGFAPKDRLVDVVCHMEVNAAWGIKSTFNGKTYHFCTHRCRERFDQDPEPFLLERCMVCRTPLTGNEDFPATYLGTTYQLCSGEHRTEFKADPAGFFMHTMWGIPSWLYYASIAVVLIVSFGVFDWLSRRGSTLLNTSEPTRFGSDQIRGEGERWLGLQRLEIKTNPDGTVALPILAGGAAGHTEAHGSIAHRTLTWAASAPADAWWWLTRGSDRFDLLGVRWVGAALRSRLFRFAMQAVFVFAFLVVIAAGLFGHQNPAMNIAPILTWTIWWGLLIVLIMFAGKAWCYVCPWDAIAGWTEKLSFWRKNDDGLSLNRKWPRVVRNILIATVMFVGLTWIELGFGVTMSPRVTAYLAIAMLLMAVGSALLFDRKSFCRYGCLVGRVSGLYAMFAGVEVRAKSASTCKGCSGKECVTGSDTAYGCPTFLFPGKLDTNTYCIQCMECVQACPHDNLAVNMRPWGADLVIEGKPRTDEAYLALLMLAITGFHGLTMTPVWQQLIDGIRGVGNVGRTVGFSVGMALLMLGPIAVYALLAGISKWLATGHTTRPMTYHDYFVRYAYALLPIALFYHIAHNMEHLLMEGPKVVAMVSDPMGWGWNLLGTANWTIPPMISLSKLWLVQAFLVLVGHVYSLWVAQRTSLRLFGSGRAAFRSQLPMLVGMIAFSVFSLWLLKQPMEMRTSAM